MPVPDVASLIRATRAPPLSASAPVRLVVNQPRDLLQQVKNHCLYQKLPLELSPEVFDLAVDNYFAIM